MTNYVKTSSFSFIRTSNFKNILFILKDIQDGLSILRGEEFCKKEEIQQIITKSLLSILISYCLILTDLELWTECIDACKYLYWFFRKISEIYNNKKEDEEKEENKV